MVSTHSSRTTLAAQASVSLINNGGDIGQTLKDLGSQDSLKTLVASMATAGALNTLGGQVQIGGKSLNQITVNDGFSANLGKAVVNNLTSATLNSALTGASLQDSIQTALVSAAISAGAGKVANSIGGLTVDGIEPTLNPAGAALAHALAGCVAGAAGQGGSAGCTAGGLGALVGELAAQWFDPDGTKPQAEVLGFAQLMGGVAGALTGDGSAASVNTAANTAANAVQNNYLETRELAFALDQLKQCSGQPGCDKIVEQLQDSLRQGGWQRNAEQLKDRCLGPNPMSCANDIQNMSAALALLQDPQSRQLLGDRASHLLIERQLRDMAYTLVMIEQGQVKFENNKAMLDAMYGATKTAIELCAVVPLAGPCRAADMGLTAAEIGVSVIRGDGEAAFIQTASEVTARAANRFVATPSTKFPDALSKNALEWWGNVYGYLAGKAVGNAPDILDCGKINCRQEGAVK